MRLTVTDVSVRYRRRVAVDHVSWSLGPGFHALLGPNGAGKSSLLTTVATIRRPTSGTVELDGLRGDRIRTRLGYCPQENLRKSRFTVREHLAYMCWLHRIPSPDESGEISRILDVVDLDARADDRVGSLSGGMRRRLGIGSALVGSPNLLVLDEPSAGLDVAQRAELASVLGQVSRDAITIVSTHIVEDIIDIAETVTIMDSGHFITDESFSSFTVSRDLDAVRSKYLAMVSR